MLHDRIGCLVALAIVTSIPTAFAGQPTDAAMAKVCANAPADGQVFVTGVNAGPDAPPRVVEVRRCTARDGSGTKVVFFERHKTTPIGVVELPGTVKLVYSVPGGIAVTQVSDTRLSAVYVLGANSPTTFGVIGEIPPEAGEVPVDGTLAYFRATNGTLWYWDGSAFAPLAASVPTRIPAEYISGLDDHPSVFLPGGVAIPLGAPAAWALAEPVLKASPVCATIEDAAPGRRCVYTGPKGARTEVSFAVEDGRVASVEVSTSPGSDFELDTSWLGRFHAENQAYWQEVKREASENEDMTEGDCASGSTRYRHGPYQLLIETASCDSGGNSFASVSYKPAN